MVAWKQSNRGNLSALQRTVPVRSLRFSISPYYGGLFYIILLVVQMLVLELCELRHPLPFKTSVFSCT